MGRADIRIPAVTDFLVIGAGIAGLRAAITLAEAGPVLVVTKEALGESNTQYAQGGIAVAISGAEDVELHMEDTLVAGDGLVDPHCCARAGRRRSRARERAARVGHAL